MIKKAFYFVIIAALSATPFAGINVASFSHENPLNTRTHDDTFYSKGDKLSVSESVVITVNGKPQSSNQDAFDSSLAAKGPNEDIVTVKSNNNSMTTMDRIFNFERIRF